MSLSIRTKYRLSSVWLQPQSTPYRPPILKKIIQAYAQNVQCMENIRQALFSALHSGSLTANCVSTSIWNSPASYSSLPLPCWHNAPIQPHCKRGRTTSTNTNKTITTAFAGNSRTSNITIFSFFCTMWTPQQILFMCTILDVVRCYLWLFTLYFNIKIGEIVVKC